jgi:hypothetical protein
MGITSRRCKVKDLILSSKLLLIGTVVALLAAGISGSALAKTFKLDCNKKSELQKTIDASANGDLIEITGICMENIRIADKTLTLIGADSPGPHGIEGIAARTDGIRIENSPGTHLEGLQINNPHSTGVRIKFSQNVSMTDCDVSDSGGGRATGIYVQQISFLNGTRLRLDRNLRGLVAYMQSEFWCRECDLNDNNYNAAYSSNDSTVTLLDSVVTGLKGILAINKSYIDIDCENHESSHDCSLEVDDWAGIAQMQSTVAFYGSGDFTGWVRAWDRSAVQLLGARQQVNSGRNIIDENSSLSLKHSDFSGNSRLTGDTDVTGFSNALFYGGDTELDGTLTCDSAGDAWVEPGIDLSGFTISGCLHAP